MDRISEVFVFQGNENNSRTNQPTGKVNVVRQQQSENLTVENLTIENPPLQKPGALTEEVRMPALVSFSEIKRTLNQPVDNVRQQPSKGFAVKNLARKNPRLQKPGILTEEVRMPALVSIFHKTKNQPAGNVNVRQQQKERFTVENLNLLNPSLQKPETLAEDIRMPALVSFSTEIKSPLNQPVGNVRQQPSESCTVKNLTSKNPPLRKPGTLRKDIRMQSNVSVTNASYDIRMNMPAMHKPESQSYNLANIGMYFCECMKEF